MTKPEIAKRIDTLHNDGVSYAKIGKILGMSKNKALSIHRRYKFGMSNEKFYRLKALEEQSRVEYKITLPKVTGIYNNRYQYKEMRHAFI